MPTGKCDICGNTGEVRVCWKCGKKVCMDHFSPQDGLCSNCKGAKPMGGGGELTIPDSAKPTTVKPGDVRK
ncbi:MAG: hypothetical protein KAW41_00630 [Candidatus Diapherotrites archaeon]|nr:hypothetical protein [Candidatus Diapherotrites archaeon]